MTQPTPPETPTSEHHTQPTRRRSRRLRLALAGVAASALVVTGGVGAAALAEGSGARTSQTTPSYGQRTAEGPGGWGYRQDQEDQGTYGWGSGPVYGGSSQQSTDTDTASGTQLTGLVRIQTELGYDSGEAAGTGMILTSDGEVVTNHHVVEGATSITVTVMSTGKQYTATVIGTDATDDVALLKLEGASGLTPVTTDTDAVSVGDAVTAVGDANGAQTLSAAAGTVTALDESITTSDEGSVQGQRLTGLIRIDADVISGDSGGATYDGEGEVLGMTTAASSGSSNITGYAIPISKVLSIVDDLRDGVTSSNYEYGYPGFLGIGLSEGSGTTVAGVYDDTPAADAGLAEGDTITSIDGTSVSTADALTTAISGHQPGDQIQVAWTDSDGASHTATITLIQGPVA